MEFLEKLNKVVIVRAFPLDEKKKFFNQESNYEIDIIRLQGDINNAIDELNREKYKIVGMEAVMSGKGRITFNLGYSYTEGVLILAEKFIQ